MWVDRVGHKSHAEGASFHILCISPRDPVSLRLLGMLVVSTVSVYSFVAYAMVVVMYFSGLFHGHGTARYECNSLNRSCVLDVYTGSSVWFFGKKHEACGPVSHAIRRSSNTDFRSR